MFNAGDVITDQLIGIGRLEILSIGKTTLFVRRESDRLEYCMPIKDAERLYKLMPKPIIGYINFYSTGFTSNCYYTREDADSWATLDRIGCKRVEFVPGVWDD